VRVALDLWRILKRVPPLAVTEILLRTRGTSEEESPLLLLLLLKDSPVLYRRGEVRVTDDDLDDEVVASEDRESFDIEETRALCWNPAKPSARRRDDTRRDEQLMNR
jgi:hypothetical protein